LEQWRLPRPIVSLGGTAVLRATGYPTASGGVVQPAEGQHLELRIDEAVNAGEIVTVVENVEGFSQSSGSMVSSVTTTPRVHFEGGLGRTEWEIACASLGTGLGAIVGRGGAVIGFAVGYIWARRQWPGDG